MVSPDSPSGSFPADWDGSGLDPQHTGRDIVRMASSPPLCCQPL